MDIRWPAVCRRCHECLSAPMVRRRCDVQYRKAQVTGEGTPSSDVCAKCERKDRLQLPSEAKSAERRRLSSGACADVGGRTIYLAPDRLVVTNCIHKA